MPNKLIDDLYTCVEAKRERFAGSGLSEFVVEAAGIDDFANILGSNLHRTLIQAYRDMTFTWDQWTKRGQVGDFRTYDRIAGSEAEDLLELGPGGAGPYQDSKLSEQKYSVKARTKGRMFSVTRQALINDDLGYLHDQAARFGRSASRTLAKDVVGFLESNPSAYDGLALFHTSHSNLLTGPASGLSQANLDTARRTIQRARFQGEYMNLAIDSLMLVVPPELENQADILVNSEYIPFPVDSNATPTGVGNLNPIRNKFNIVVDKYLTSTTAWYVVGDPNFAPAIEVVFLNGHDQPDLMIQRPEYQMVAGAGTDEFLHGQLDELRYAVRFDYGYSGGLYQGVVKGAGV